MCGGWSLYKHFLTPEGTKERYQCPCALLTWKRCQKQQQPGPLPAAADPRLILPLQPLSSSLRATTADSCVHLEPAEMPTLSKTQLCLPTLHAFVPITAQMASVRTVSPTFPNIF